MFTNQDLMVGLENIIAAWDAKTIKTPEVRESLDALIKAAQLMDRDAALKKSDVLLIDINGKVDGQERVLDSMDAVRIKMETVIARREAQTIDTEDAKVLMAFLNMLANTYKASTTTFNNTNMAANTTVQVDGVNKPINELLSAELQEVAKNYASYKYEISHLKKQISFWINLEATEWTAHREKQWQQLLAEGTFWDPPHLPRKSEGSGAAQDDLVRRKPPAAAASEKLVNPPPPPKGSKQTGRWK